MRRRRSGADGQGSVRDGESGGVRACGGRARGATAQFVGVETDGTFRETIVAKRGHDVQRSAQVVTRKDFHSRTRRQSRDTANRAASEPARRPENDEGRMEKRTSCREVDAADEQREQRDRSEQAEDEVQIGA